MLRPGCSFHAATIPVGGNNGEIPPMLRPCRVASRVVADIKAVRPA